MIIDEIHSLAPSKRGDLLSLALAQLAHFSPNVIRIGLSATVAHPEKLATWLGNNSEILTVNSRNKPHISLLDASARIPYSGYMARYALATIYNQLAKYKLTLIFVNTRAQAEFIFQHIWQINSANYPIAIYHGSIHKDHRLKIEKLIGEKKLKAIITTSALELGIDWGDIDCVIQVGAPRGISRLIQRVGRSNHQFNQTSVAQLVPTNCFDALECQAAIEAIENNKLDSEELYPGSLDVVVQFIINCACSEPIQPKKLFNIIRSAHPYQTLKFKTFLSLFKFAIDGGYVLKHYEQYHRLKKYKNSFLIASPKFARRHRQNIGTIIESPKLYVKLKKGNRKVLGEIEENFIQQLSTGDTFLFSGKVLTFERIRDMFVEVSMAKAKDPKLPSYLGGTLPLSTLLAEQVSNLINQPQRWQKLPKNVQEWLELQKKFSSLPHKDNLLIEQCIFNKDYYLVIYSFQGRLANHTLAMLITKRMENLKLKPISFTVTEYGLCIRLLVCCSLEIVQKLLDKNLLKEELIQWLNASPLLKRTFRQVAIISGLVERQYAGQRKSLKQVTFSTELIYDVLKRHEPQHILFHMTETNVFRELLDLPRLQAMLSNFENKIIFVNLNRPSPMSIPIINSFNTENIKGQGAVELLLQAEKEERAENMLAEVREYVRNKIT